MHVIYQQRPRRRIILHNRHSDYIPPQKRPRQHRTRHRQRRYGRRRRRERERSPPDLVVRTLREAGDGDCTVGRGAGYVFVRAEGATEVEISELEVEVWRDGR